MATKIHHKKKKKKAQPLPSSSKSQNNHHHNHKTSIGEKKENNHKTQISEKKEERQRGKPSCRRAKHQAKHTHKLTTANLHKSKPITPIHYTTTHNNPETHANHNPKSQTHNLETYTHANHNPKSQTHNPKAYAHTNHNPNQKPTTRPTPITILNHKFTSNKIKSPCH